MTVRSWPPSASIGIGRSCSPKLLLLLCIPEHLVVRRRQGLAGVVGEDDSDGKSATICDLGRLVNYLRKPSGNPCRHRSCE
jgi:hypothetical protein